jgi:hypothetical protein
MQPDELEERSWRKRKMQWRSHRKVNRRKQMLNIVKGCLCPEAVVLLIMVCTPFSTTQGQYLYPRTS